MSEARLDQLVKGTPPPNVSLPSVAAAASASVAESRESPAPSDPTSLLPSSPPQIYLNLLILEASLRAQYLTLRARRRQNTFVLIVLLFWILYFVWCQFLRPRADGKVGGSEYWLVDIIEKVALLSGVVMGLLFKLTGQWDRGVRWPSKWLRTTNRGLRGMNCKVVVLKGPWWRETISHLSFLFPISTLVENPGSNYQYVEYAHGDRRVMPPPSRPRVLRESVEVAEEDIAPGGDYIKILLLPKHFTPEFRENWEVYRAEYWDQENRRRQGLRSKFRAKRKQIAKQKSPWLWWLPGRRNLIKAPTPTRHFDDKLTHHNSSLGRAGSQRHKRTSSVMREKEPSHSRSSSRSSVGMGNNPDDEIRERRWSTTSTTSSVGGERRRRKVTAPSTTSSLVADAERRGVVAGRVKLTPATATSTTASARPTTPVSDSGFGTGSLRTRASNLSTMSSGSGTISSSEGDSPTRRRYNVYSADGGSSNNPSIKREPVD